MKHCAALILHRRLLERSLQVMRGRGCGTASRRGVGRFSQRRHSRSIARRWQTQQVPGDVLALGPPRGQQLSRLDVQCLAFEGRDLLVHRTANHRMDEVKRPISCQHVDPGECVGCLGRLRRVRPGER